MILRLSLYGLLLAFPLLYLSGAVWGSPLASTLALLFVAAICLALLRPTTRG